MIGLAIARELAPSRSVVLLEQESHFGEHLSSRNSEVIHAGLYYPPDSLKARLCLRGNTLLYQYCQAQSIPHRQCGKLIIANAGQQDSLEQLHHNALNSDATGLHRCSQQWLQQQEVGCLALDRPMPQVVLGEVFQLLRVEPHRQAVFTAVAFGRLFVVRDGGVEFVA